MFPRFFSHAGWVFKQINLIPYAFKARVSESWTARALGHKWVAIRARSPMSFGHENSHSYLSQAHSWIFVLANTKLYTSPYRLVDLNFKTELVAELAITQA